jgi:hypothetical protein
MPITKGEISLKKGASFQSNNPGERILNKAKLCLEKGHYCLTGIDMRRRKKHHFHRPGEKEDKVVMVMENMVVAVL